MFLRKISLPFQLVGVIAFVLFFGKFMGLEVVRACYTFSLVFKELLGLFLPAVIFSFVVTGIFSFRKNAPYVLSVVALLVYLSNAGVALLVYAVGRMILPFIASDMQVEALSIESVVTPWWQPFFACPISSEKALLIALIIGAILSFYPSQWVETRLQALKELVISCLSNFFIPLLPLYVLGFLLKINYEGVFVLLFSHYGGAFVLIVTLQIIWLLFCYAFATGFSSSKTFEAVKNALPSYLTAFSTMSSSATVPVSVACAEKNTGNKPLSEICMPIMANIHLLGDSISTPLLAMVTMNLFLGYLPGFEQYAGFVIYFCTTMFAVSAVPGGGIIVTIPILITHLGFTSEMISIITTLYLLLDSFGTAANVMGDGALVMIVQRVLRRLKIT